MRCYVRRLIYPNHGRHNKEPGAKPGSKVSEFTFGEQCFCRLAGSPPSDTKSVTSSSDRSTPIEVVVDAALDGVDARAEFDRVEVGLIAEIVVLILNLR